MVSHVLLMMVFALCVSTVLAVLMRDEPKEEMRLGAKLLGGFVGAAFILGWLLYPFPL